MPSPSRSFDQSLVLNRNRRDDDSAAMRLGELLDAVVPLIKG